MSPRIDGQAMVQLQAFVDMGSLAIEAGASCAVTRDLQLRERMLSDPSTLRDQMNPKIGVTYPILLSFLLIKAYTLYFYNFLLRHLPYTSIIFY